MKYTILTLDKPEREPYKENIRTVMRGREHQEVFIECVDGRNKDQLDKNIERHGFNINFPVWRPGEGGVWYSSINAWKSAWESGEGLLVFEDDAILDAGFADCLSEPEDVDFITYYLPYRNPHQCRPFRLVPSYQEHGNVCIWYSAQGAYKILDMLGKEGLDWPVDIWLFKKALAGELVGLGPDESSRIIVDVDYAVPSTIQEDERVRVYQP
jgi:GR25 family glycosyltransferase involved in LPS biosynthesis